MPCSQSPSVCTVNAEEQETARAEIREESAFSDKEREYTHLPPRGGSEANMVAAAEANKFAYIASAGPPSLWEHDNGTEWNLHDSHPLLS